MSKTKSPSKSRLRFGIKSLLVMMVLVAIMLGLITQPIQERWRQQRLLAELGAGKFEFLPGSSTLGERSLGKSLLKVVWDPQINIEMLRHVVASEEVTDGDVAQLANVKHVFRLNLSGSSVTDEMVESLIQMPYLRALDLSNTAVTDAGIAKLSALSDLQVLRSNGTAVSYEALEVLQAEVPGINAAENRAAQDLSNRGLRIHALPGRIPANSFGYTNRSLEFHGHTKRNAGYVFDASDMRKISYLQSLEDLTIYDATIQSGALAELKPLPKLRCLRLKMIALTHQDIAALCKQSSLSDITIAMCGLSKDDVEQIRRSFPAANLQLDYAMLPAK